MSKANSSARQRRAGGAVLPGQETKPVASTFSPVSSQQQSGLSLQQVIALVDKRLVALETFAKETKDTPPVAQTSVSAPTVNPEEINALADEFNGKFELLANELSELKDIVMKLQSYTMEVNKTLMQDRVRMLSDMGSGNEIEINVQELGGEGFTMSGSE
jgi:hypothetical protein